MKIPIISAIIDLFKTPVQGYVERKNIETQGKVAATQKLIDYGSAWELKALDKDSWTDEWLVILISIPLVLCFIPSTADDVMRGFEVLVDTPEWYQYLVGGVFSVTFGRRELMSAMSKRTATKLAEKAQEKPG